MEGPAQDQSAQVLDALMAGDPAARLAIVADLLFQAESYVRTLKQAMRGLTGSLLADEALYH